MGDIGGVGNGADRLASSVILCKSKPEVPLPLTDLERSLYDCARHLDRVSSGLERSFLSFLLRWRHAKGIFNRAEDFTF